MRSPKKTKSTRRTCPIGINCELVAAERNRVCPNRRYCSELIKPWSLPYYVPKCLSDGTRILTVRAHEDRRAREYPSHNQAGWYSPRKLPYIYVQRPEYSKPILHVYIDSFKKHEMPSFGWQNAEDIPGYYYLQESWLHFVQPLQTNYPHCILPPEY